MNTEERARLYLQRHEDASVDSLHGHLLCGRDEAESLYDRFAEPREAPESDGGCPGGCEAVGVESGVIPKSMKRRHEWLTWKPTPDGRKIPRAPWEKGDDTYVSAHDPEMWTGHLTAAKWASSLPGHSLAFDLVPEEHDPEHVLIDFDYARDAETGEIPGCVLDLVERAGSYADVSTSGTGVHILGRARLPDGVNAVDDVLCEEHGVEIEVYDSRRFIAMTGEKLAGTPDDALDVQPLVDELAEEYATSTDATPDGMLSRPEKTREEVSQIGTTGDMQDVFDAVQHVRPGDIRLSSTVTNERGNGRSLDPSWTHSESGTRLWEDADGWVYRKGMHYLDALQVVALEERIITSPGEYPSGEDWNEAVDALRDRGASIPEYTGKTTPSREALGIDEEAETVEDKIQQFLASNELAERS